MNTGFLWLSAIALTVTACLDLTVTVEMPCTISLVQYDTTSGQDTLAVVRADSFPCPRSP